MARIRPIRGEIWLVDLGIAQKTRPVVILSVEPDDRERLVVTYVARTTSLRGTRFEVPHTATGFQPGAFDAQSVGTIPYARLTRKIGSLNPDELADVQDAVGRWLSL